MTLVKSKPKRPTVEHRRRTGQHHRHSHDYLKTYWPYLPVVSILSLGIFVNSWLGQVNRSVLGYATDMSIQSLLDDTNAQRLGDNESALRINSKLNVAAQNKANDMAARDYWSHNTPDGQTPWTFITAAGYNYSIAGENLAYGFDTAADTITGWMNSPEHRANVLNGSYRDVGFGIINISDYQGTGPETLVVAMYGTAVSAPVASTTPKVATPIPQASKHETTANAKKAAPTKPTPIATTIPASNTSQQKNSDTLEPSQQSISRVQLVSSSAPMNTLALSLFGLSALGFVILRHGFAWRRLIVHGEAFVLHHPMLDISAATIISMVIVLSHTAGVIR